MPTEQCCRSSEGSLLAPPGEIVWWSHSKWLFSCYLFILLHQPLLHPHDYPIPLFTSSVQLLSCVLQPHGLQHTRPPCSSPTPGVYSDTRASSWWCHPTISSSVIPFSCHLQSFQASESFQMTQFFESGGQSMGVSASESVLPVNIQNCFPLEWTGWISLQSKGHSRVSSNTTVQKHQFFSTQPSSQSNFHIHTWPQEKP